MAALNYEAKLIAAQEVELGPLGEELAEANVAEGSEMGDEETVTKADQKITVAQADKSSFRRRRMVNQAGRQRP